MEAVKDMREYPQAYASSITQAERDLYGANAPMVMTPGKFLVFWRRLREDRVQRRHYSQTKTARGEDAAAASGLAGEQRQPESGLSHLQTGHLLAPLQDCCCVQLHDATSALWGCSWGVKCDCLVCQHTDSYIGRHCPYCKAFHARPYTVKELACQMTPSGHHPISITQLQQGDLEDAVCSGRDAVIAHSQIDQASAYFKRARVVKY
jgi:hypothetical protein